MKNYYYLFGLISLSLILILNLLFVSQNYILPPDTGYHNTISTQINQKENFIFWDDYNYAGSINPYTPLFHLNSVILSKTIGVDILPSFFVLTGLALFMFPFAIFLFLSNFFNKFTSFLSAIFVSLLPSIFKLTYGKLPQLFSVVLIFFGLYFLIKYLNQEKIYQAGLFLIFSTGVILYHHLTGFIYSILVLTFFISHLIKSRIDHKLILKGILLFFLLFILISPWLLNTFEYHTNTLKSQTQEKGRLEYKINNDLNNLFNIKSNSQIPIFTFVFSILGILSYLFKNRKKSAGLMCLILVPLIISFGYLFGFYLQNSRFLFFSIVFLSLFSGYGLHIIFRQVPKKIFILLFIVLLLFSVQTLETRSLSLSNSPYNENLDSSVFIEKMSGLSNYIGENSTVFTDGYSRSVLWIPGILKRKVIIVARPESYGGTNIHEKILDGISLLSFENETRVNEIVNKYGGEVFIVIQNYHRVGCGGNCYLPDYNSFYNYEGDLLKITVLESNSIAKLIKIKSK